jgi:16S rRNA processing protein RimM
MKIPIAKIGKTYGVKGWQKLHLLTDFPEQFKVGAIFGSDKINLTIEKIDLKRNLVKFKGIDTPEDAKKLTNRVLYSTPEKTREDIKLKKDEYFWFDIIGCDVIENDKILGKVIDIERADVDYLVIKTNESLVKEKYPKRFLIDFKRNVDKVDIENKKIYAKGAIELLESLK